MIRVPGKRPTEAELRAMAERAQALLHKHSPGEKFFFPLTTGPAEIPPHCLREIETAGPSVVAFFHAANRIFKEVPWVRPLLEKRYHPNYRRLNDAQPDAIPWNPRPDIVPDENWNPKFVELEITVAGRAEGAPLNILYGTPPRCTSAHLYKEMLDRRGIADRPLALIAAYHPAYPEIGYDARCFVSVLREIGVNIEAILDEDLPYLSYRNGRLKCLRPGHAFEFTHFDRLIDIFEIAELAHAGMRPLLDAYLDGAATDVNTCKQFLDEKIWLALFWDPRLEADWRRHLPEEALTQLRRVLPFTAFLTEDTKVPLGGKWVPAIRLADVPADERRFITKESGTSETAAAAQSFRVLREMDKKQAREHLRTIVNIGPPSILQELVESARVEFDAYDPEKGEFMHRENARVKMTAFYIDGTLGDLLFISSNKQVAVHDADYMETLVSR